MSLLIKVSLLRCESFTNQTFDSFRSGKFKLERGGGGGGGGVVLKRTLLTVVGKMFKFYKALIY